MKGLDDESVVSVPVACKVTVELQKPRDEWLVEIVDWQPYESFWDSVKIYVIYLLY